MVFFWVSRIQDNERTTGGKKDVSNEIQIPLFKSEEVLLYRKSSTGAQRYFCQKETCKHKIFQLEYMNNASKPGIVEMEMNGSGVRVLDVCYEFQKIRWHLFKNEKFFLRSKRNETDRFCDIKH